MKFEEAIRLAKKICENEYERRMRVINAYNPHYKRKWYIPKELWEEGKEVWALKGTPDKALVFIYRDKGLVVGLVGMKEEYVRFENLEADEIILETK